MGAKKINFKDAAQKYNFFNKLYKLKHDREDAIQKIGELSNLQFDSRDEEEIGRGNTYAVFPELEGKDITISIFREALQKNGINDSSLQNKILVMILQNRVGIQYNFGSAISDIISKDQPENYLLCMDPKYKLKMKVCDEGNGVYIMCEYKVIARDPYNSKNCREAFTVNVTLKVSPGDIYITESKISKNSKFDVFNAIFEKIKQKITSLTEKIRNNLNSNAKDPNSDKTLDQEQEQNNGPKQ